MAAADSIEKPFRMFVALASFLRLQHCTGLSGAIPFSVRMFVAGERKTYFTVPLLRFGLHSLICRLLY